MKLLYGRYMQMKDGRDQNWRTDESGFHWLIDENGNDVTVNGERIPGPPRQLKSESGFTHYDTSQGHCVFCGRLTCGGGCFK